MSLQSQLKKSKLYNLDFLTNSKEIYKNQKTKICLNSTINIITLEFEKYQFYYYGLQSKLSCVPKIHQLIADDKHGIYYIEREILFPVIETKKLDAIKKTEYCIKKRLPGEDKIAKELLKFYYLYEVSVDFDFGPHWIMQNNKGKLVVSDAFRAINQRATKDLSSKF